MSWRTHTHVCAVVVAIAVLSVQKAIWDLSPIDPVVYSLPELPSLPAQGDAIMHSLEDAEIWLDGKVRGAEHIDFRCEHQRCHAYAGLADGSIVRFDPAAGPLGEVEVLNGTWALSHGSSPSFQKKCGDVDLGELCGRPLGLKVAPDGTRLVIADAYLGLLAMDLASRELSVLADEYIGRDGAIRKVNMANSLVISREGSVFFTLTSPRFSLKNLMLEFAQGRANGLLLSIPHYTTPGIASIVADGLVKYLSLVGRRVMYACVHAPV